MKKVAITNIVLTFLEMITFLKIMDIENTSRLPKYLNTDYHFHSLPYIYLSILIMLIIFGYNLFIIFRRKNR